MTINPAHLQKKKQFDAYMRANPQYDTRNIGGRIYDAVKKPILVTAGIVGLGWLGYAAYTHHRSHHESSIPSTASNNGSNLEQIVTSPSSHDASVVSSKSKSTKHSTTHSRSESNIALSDTPDIDGDSVEDGIYAAVPVAPPRKSTPSVHKSTSPTKQTVSSKKKGPTTLYFSNSSEFHDVLYEYIRTGTEEQLGIPECQNFTVKHGQGALDSMTVVPYQNILNFHNQNNLSDRIDRLSDIVLEFQQGGKLLPLLQSSGNGKKEVVFLFNMSSSEPCNVPDGSVFNRTVNLNVNGRGFRLASSPNSYSVGYDPNLFALVALEYIPDSRYTVNGTELGGKVTNMTVRRAEIAALKEHKALAFGAGLVAGNVFPAGTTYVNAAAILSTIAGIGNNRSTPKHEITGVDTEVIRALAEQSSVSTNFMNYLSGISSRHEGVVFNYNWKKDTFSSSDFPAMANIVLPLRAGNSEKITIRNGDSIGDISVILVRQGASPVVLEPGWLRKLKDSTMETNLTDVDINGNRIVYTFREYPHVPGKLVEQSNLFDNKWNINYRPFAYDHNIVEMCIMVNSYPTSTGYSGKETLDSKAVIGSSKGGMSDSKAVISDSKSGMTPSNTYFIHFGNREIERDPHFLAWFAAGYNLHLPDKPPHKTSNPPGRTGGPVKGPLGRGNGSGGIGSRTGGPVGGPASGSGSSSYSSGSYTGGR